MFEAGRIRCKASWNRKIVALLLEVKVERSCTADGSSTILLGYGKGKKSMGALERLGPTSITNNLAIPGVHGVLLSHSTLGILCV